MVERKGWVLHVTGELDDPDGQKVVVVRHDRPQIRLEIDAPGIEFVPDDHVQRARQVVQDAVTAIQKVLDSPSGLPGLR